MPAGFNRDADGEVRGGGVLRSSDEKLMEAINLAGAIGVEVVFAEFVNLSKVNPPLLLGGGKVDELTEKVAEMEARLVIVDAALSPRQQRNLEERLGAKVLDRTGLILEIFGERARTRAGRLQVELARLTYEQSRLVRQWTHLERQRGGMGKTGGPGERQLELDKRMLRTRMAAVRRELADVEQTRGLQRMARGKAALPTVALVGYTNAGKSTLFNRLVDAGTLMADALFATLDPLMRKLKLPDGLEVVLVDTVGFVSDLPHELVEAFKATLEEVVMADVLLHVHDAATPEREAQAADVREVLRQLGAADKTVVQVYNKADMLDDDARALVPVDGLSVSAKTGEGVPELLAAIEEILTGDWVPLNVRVNAGEGRLLAWLHAHGKVKEQALDDDVWVMRVMLRPSDVAVWERMGNGDVET
ncbi:MAG: GTPase HflX [Alphaproteobacteria bacterium CG_4_10_14_0_8_um_filter_53_9]|nr:MAG: GTPase HflX [Alphaproteobacteria bacterium CG_4_10_14_0_8_um_filter_53_9]